MRQARFEIRDGEKEERRTISNPVSSIILEIRAPSGGGGRGEDIERAFFFFLTFYSAGKIEGGGWGTRVARVSRVDEPRRYEIPSRLLFSGKCSREGFPREAINLHPNRGNHYFHRGMAHLQSKQINPSPLPPSSRHEYLVLMLIL